MHVPVWKSVDKHKALVWLGPVQILTHHFIDLESSQTYHLILSDRNTCYNMLQINMSKASDNAMSIGIITSVVLCT